MKKKLLLLVLVMVIFLSGLFVVRFMLGGDEDAWICTNKQWIKHGNPSSPMPTSECKS